VSPATADSPSSQRRLGFWVGLALFATVLALPSPQGLSPQAQRAAAVAVLMAVWWIAETVDIAVTSFLPIPLFPLLGIQSARQVAGYYADHIVFLYLGGFLIALSMERWNLHRRVALNVIRQVGSQPSRLVLGFMIATAFLSMWISNTATTMMMLPIAAAVVNQLAELAVIDGQRGPAVTERARVSFGVILLLAIAYSASVGGVGTIIGSPTNVAFLGFVSETFPQYPTISFVEWSMVCVPIVIVFIPLMWVYLCRFAADLPLSRIHFGSDVDVIEDERRKLGSMRYEERAVLAVSVLTALLWILRSPLELGGFTIPGWASLFEDPGSVQDSTVAMAMAVALFVLPARTLDSEGKQQRLLDWGTALRGVPWGIVFLFGGGFALAGAIADTGLAKWIGGQMAVLEGAPIWILVPLTCLLSALLTETTSNIATVLMLSPVIAATAVQIGVHPYLLLFPAAIMASFAFMLPVATPPNAIVFSSGWISIRRMFRAGFALDLMALLVVPLLVYVLGMAVFPFGSSPGAP
jgi:solute carrier family 13 (sodium-dependent dicarboxylate transporter), member 2/3/5